MEVIIRESPEKVASIVAAHVCKFVRSKAAAVLDLATGKTPWLTYYKAIEMAQEEGISAHGHIAFNEPTSSLASRTRVKTLTGFSRRANAGHFADIELRGNDEGSLRAVVSAKPENVPIHVVTQGIGTILESHHAILIATGVEKAATVAQAVEGPLTSFIPASALQMHRHATFVLDEDAASELKMLDYYRQIQINKRYIQPSIT